MTLSEFFDLCDNTQDVLVSVCGGYQYDGMVVNCPAHLLDNEVTRTRTSAMNKLIVFTERPECPGMTWRQLADAIESMPDWAQDMPVDVYIEDSRFIHSLSNHGVREIVTYFSKEPKDIEDDGQDYVSLILDTHMG